MFEVSGTYAGGRNDGAYAFDLSDGVLQDGGRSLSFSMKVKASGGAQSGTTVVDVDVVILQSTDLFIRPTVAAAPSGSSALIRTWWRYPLALAKSAPSVSPDPSLMRSQAEVVSVSSDLGRTVLNGRKAYHYAVTLDPEKLRQFLQRSAMEKQEPFDEEAMSSLLRAYVARGELWIDASNFFTHRIEWSFSPTALAKPGTPSMRFRVDLRDVNDAPGIAAPEGAKPLSITGGVLDLLPSLPTSSPLFKGFFLTP